MAKKISNLAEVKVYINGKEQAKRDLDDLKKKAEEFKAQLDATKQSISDNTSKMKEARERANASTEGSVEHTNAVQDMLDAQTAIDEGEKKKAELEKSLKQTNKLIRETEKFAKDIAEDLENLSGQRIKRLNEMKRQIEAIRNSLDPEEDKDGTFLAFLNDAFNRIVETIKNKKGEIVEFSDIMDDLTNIDDTSLTKTEQRLRSLLAATDKDDVERIKQLKDELSQVTGERQRRVGVEAEAIMGGDYAKTIEGTKQAIELLKKYQETLDTTETEKFREIGKAIQDMNADLERASREQAAKVMENPLGFSVDELNEAIKLTEKLQSAADDTTVWNSYEEQLVKAREARDRFADDSKHQAMAKQFESLAGLSANAYTEQKKYWEAMRDSGKYYDEAIANLEKMAALEKKRLAQDAEKVMGGDYAKTIEGTQQAIKLLEKYQETLDASDTDGIERVTKSIRKMNEELETAARERAAKVMANPTGFSPEEINEAIKLTEKLQAATPDGEEWTKYARQIEEAKQARDKFAEDAKFDIMNEQFQQFDDLSKKAAASQKKYWEDLADSMDKTDGRYQTVLDNVKKIKDAEKAQLTSSAAEIMGGTYDKTIEGTKQAIELLKKYQQTLDATETDKINDVTDSIKYMNAELEAAARKRAEEVMNNPTGFSVEEINEAIKVTEKLQAATPDGDAWTAFAEAIEEAKKARDKFTDDAKFKIMNTQFADLENLSVNALAEQKKYWTEVKNTYGEASNQYKTAVDNLQKIKDLEDRNTKADATQAITDIKSGGWDKTIKETEKAIKLIEEYKKQLHVKTDAAAIDEANQAITILNQNLGKAKEALMDVNDAINIGTQLEQGNFDGTTEEILRAKKALEEYRKTLKQKTDATTIKRVDEALRNVTNSAEQAKNKLVNIEDVLGRLDTASMEELQAAAKQLQDQLTSMERDSDPTSVYAKTAKKLRDVKAELEEVKHEWEEHDNVIIRTAKRLAAYVAVYGGFNAIAGQLRSLFDANLQLSDSFADIQKTTGLTSDAIKELSRDINSIDTRSTQAQLHELAAVAGQIGLKSQEDILGFVKASNMITVSLNELGSEGTASLMKLAQLTGEIKENGVEKSLMAIGSSINELSANSAATAGPIVDLMNRMGGIASQSNITTAELAAIGATADAIGQSMEITGTSMNKFIATLMSSSDQIAYSLNMDAKALNDMLEAGDTMEAMLMVFERMQDMGGISALAPVMKDLGSEGARMMQLLSAMAQNVGFLRNQVDLSREAFEEAISIENEYNIKNENAIALLQRMGNTLNEMWVNSTFVTGLTWILKQLNSFVSWLAEGNTGARVLKTAMIMLGSAIALASMHLDAFAKALFKAKTYTDLFNKSWDKMGELLKKNWISIVIGAFVSLGYYIWQTITYVSELDRATNRYNAELDRENNIMKNLFNGLQRDNITRREKSKLINEINQRYGKYLDFLITERDSVSELAAAYELANARMRESAATRLSNKQLEILDESYGQKMSENRDSLQNAWKKWNLDGREKEATSAVRRITMENLEKEVGQIQDLIAKEFERLFGNSNAVSSEVAEYIKLQKEYYAEFEQINEEAAQNLEQAQKATADANVKVMEEMFKQVQDLSTGVTKASADGPFKSALDIQRGIVQEGEQFIEYASKNLNSLTKEQREKVDANIKLVQQQMEVARKQLPEGDPWGKEVNLKGWKETLDNLPTASLDSLVSTYKELRDAPKVISDVSKYNRMFEEDFTSLGEVMEDTHNKAEKIKEELAKRGRTTTGDFLWGGGSGGKKPKDEFEAALASLEAYYNDREEIVRKNALLEETTQEELDKRLQSLEQEHLSARIELRKLMLSKENSFLTTFSHAAESEYMQGIDYNKLQTQLGKLGKAMSQGLEKNLTADMVTLQKIAWEHQEEISKILIENDPVKKVALEYQQSFEKIDLFWAADELRTKDAANEKMATLLEFSAKRADLNDEDMRTQLETSKQFGNVVKTMTAEEYQAFLVLLDQYAEAATNAKRQATQKAIKNLEFGFDNSILGKQVAAQLKNLEEMEAQFGEIDSLGLVQEATSLKKHKEFVEQSIALEQVKWNAMIEIEKNGMNRSEVLQDLMLERDKATYEARLEVMKLIMDMDVNMFEESNSRIDQMQGWGAISEIDATERQRSLIYAELGLKQMRIDELIRIEEEGQNRMDVINNLRLAKQDALYKADRRLTELTMQEYQQRAQVAQEWGTAIGTGLGEMIAGTEDAGKNLVKNLATMAVQSIGQMAQMYVAKQLLLSQQNMSEAASAMTTATTAAAEATAVGAAKTAEATAIAMATPDSVLTGGASGAAKAAVISGLIAAAVAASIAIINSLFPGAGSKATASTRKLSTGMLTYAEGNYPVLGNDGKVYDAKYEGAGMKTGIYGGGAHFGIFSEKQPEMIVDGKTTQKLILNYPYIYDAITTIAKNGRLVNAMPTFASGDYPAGMRQIAQVETTDASGGASEQMAMMQEELAQSREVNRRLLKVLEGGLVAHVDGLENYKQQKKNERFLKRRGID